MQNASQPAFPQPLNRSSRKMSTMTRKSSTNHMTHRKNQSMVRKALARGKSYAR